MLWPLSSVAANIVCKQPHTNNTHSHMAHTVGCVHNCLALKPYAATPSHTPENTVCQQAREPKTIFWPLFLHMKIICRCQGCFRGMKVIQPKLDCCVMRYLLCKSDNLVRGWNKKAYVLFHMESVSSLVKMSVSTKFYCNLTTRNF